MVKRCTSTISIRIRNKACIRRKLWGLSYLVDLWALAGEAIPQNDSALIVAAGQEVLVITAPADTATVEDMESHFHLDIQLVTDTLRSYIWYWMLLFCFLQQLWQLFSSFISMAFACVVTISFQVTSHNFCEIMTTEWEINQFIEFSISEDLTGKNLFIFLLMHYFDFHNSEQCTST